MSDEKLCSQGHVIDNGALNCSRCGGTAIGTAVGEAPVVNDEEILANEAEQKDQEEATETTEETATEEEAGTEETTEESESESTEDSTEESEESSDENAEATA